PVYLSSECCYHFLHVSAVAIDGEAVLFMAPSTGGKSTLAQHCVARGHQLVADDKLAIIEESDRFLAVPSHPNYRPYRKNEDLGFRAEQFCASPLPIRVMFRLEPVSSV